jgi:hypothetical protein
MFAYWLTCQKLAYMSAYLFDALVRLSTPSPRTDGVCVCVIFSNCMSVPVVQHDPEKCH